MEKYLEKGNMAKSYNTLLTSKLSIKSISMMKS